MFRKIKLWSRYHEIEQFGIVLLLVLSIVVTNLISIVVYANSEENKMIDDNAIFVNQFTTSLSQKTGSMTQLYVNEERTKCVLMFKFDTVDNLVIDASQYQVFVKAYDVSKGEYESRGITNLDVKGGFYVFGSTGYMALYLSTVNGFPHDAYEFVVRCNEVLNAADINVDISNATSSYEIYDQWRVIVNPNGKSAFVKDFINDFDVQVLYQNAVIDEHESQIRDKLFKDVSDMNIAMQKVYNYRNNLEKLNVRLPELPDYIKDDVIEKDENGVTKYTSGYNFKNGVDFEWQDYTLHDTSFIDMVKPSDMTETQFFNSYNNYAADQISFTHTWYMTDGTLINLEGSEKLNNMQTISNYIQEYEKALSDYYNAKQSYHCTHLFDYLYVEANMKSDGKYFTSNYSDGVIIVY